MLENSEGKVKKKIVININSSKAKTSESNLNSHYQSQNPKCEKNKVVDELPKLLQIADRCKDYFLKFLQEKGQQINYTETMFASISKFLNQTFDNLNEIIETKKKQIQLCINDKREQFMSIKQCQLNNLNNLIIQVQEQQNCLKVQNLEFQIKEEKVTLFATLLNQFYEQIDEIEKVNYKDNIKQSIEFLHNFIEDESAAFSQDKIFEPSIPNISISFNNEQLFSVKEDPWQEFKMLTEKRQDSLDSKISLYHQQIKV